MNSDDSSTHSPSQRQTDFDFSSLSLDFKASAPHASESQALSDDYFGMDGILGNLDYEEEEIDPFVALKAKKTPASPSKTKKTAGISLEGLRSKAKSKNEFAELFGSPANRGALKACNEEIQKTFQQMGLSPVSPVSSVSTTTTTNTGSVVDLQSGNGETSTGLNFLI